MGMALARPRLGTPACAAVLGGECLLLPVSPVLRVMTGCVRGCRLGWVCSSVPVVPFFPCRMSGWPRCNEGARGLWSAGDGSAVTASLSGQCGTQQHKPRCHSLCLVQGRGTGGCSEGAKQDSWAWGVQNQPALGTQIWSGAGHGPLDNCSSQLFLISGEISRVPAQRDAHRDEVLRKQLTMPLHWQGSGERGCWGHSALALPSLSRPPCCISPALSIVRDTETLSFPSPPSLAAVGCAVGPWGPWSGCSSPCGVGSRARSRQVTVPPRHGGDPCPDLKQRRGCLGQHPACGTAKEVAKILPNFFSQDFRDPWRRAGLPLLEEPSGYVRSRGPSVTTNNPNSVPKAGTPPAPPLQSWPLCTPQTQGLFASHSHYFSPRPKPWPPYITMALRISHRTIILPTLQTRIPLHPPRAITLLTSPTKASLPAPKPTSSLYSNPSKKPPQALPYCLPTIFPLFSSHFPPSPAPPSPATAAISA
ncbi:uncharacterized protein LOC107211765 isoform X2 [Parus major]|uniref:uncharacterized protein LOC107211765 isoform X2 n=1 Tax=Parus major TaxID=9157 RepID=UPI0008F4650B|nr:uncharacterized protein LOC107211765 isoform X2 [Parus major]